MTTPTDSSKAIGDVTTVDHAIEAYKKCIAQQIQIADEQGQAAEAAQAMATAFLEAAAQLRGNGLDVTSYNEMTAAAEAAQQVAELTKALAAAAADAAALLDTNKNLMVNRYAALQEAASALQGAEKMTMEMLQVA
jgi:adenosine deaminase